MTIGHLFNYFQKLEQVKQGSFLEIFFGTAHFRSRINSFYKNNELVIANMVRRLNEIQGKYFEFTGEGEAKRPVLHEGNPKLKQFMRLEDYTKEYNSLMAEPCNIIIL